MENKIKNSIKRSVHYFIIYCVILLLILFSISSISSIYVSGALDSEWSYVNIAINRAESKSSSNSTQMFSSLQESLSDSYSDTSLIKDDLEDLLTNSDINNTLEEILSDEITNMNLFDIDNNNNDMFIITKNLVIFDTSPNNSDYGSTRTLENEYDTYFNPTIAEKALTSIVDGDNRMVLIPSEVDGSLPWYNTIKSMTYMDTSTLKELFYKYNGDTRILNIEFYIPYYVYKNYDIAGNPIVNSVGQLNPDSYQLIFVQKFNLLDVVEYLNFDTSISSIQENSDKFILILRIFTALVLAIFFIISYSTNIKTNKEIDKFIRKGDGSGYD